MPPHIVSQASVQRRPGGQSVAHHLLTTYLKSYIAVIKTQFSTKAFQGGREVRTYWLCCSSQSFRDIFACRYSRQLLPLRRA